MPAPSYILLQGEHIEGTGRDKAKRESLENLLAIGSITQEEFDKEVKGLRPRKVYVQGDIIESPRYDLTRMNGPYPMVPKFVRADDPKVSHHITNAVRPQGTAHPSTVPINDAFSDMTTKELVKFAQEEGINLNGANKKDEILALVREHSAQMATA